jgi:hypothetical protein
MPLPTPSYSFGSARFNSARGADNRGHAGSGMTPTIRTSRAAAPGLTCRKCQAAIAPGADAVFVEGVAQTILAESEPNVFCSVAHIREFAEQQRADWERAITAAGHTAADARVARENRDAFAGLEHLAQRPDSGSHPEGPAAI